MSNPLALAAAALSGINTFSEYKWNSAISNYNAKIDDFKAQQAGYRAAAEEAKYRRNFGRFQGAFNAARAKNNVEDSGSSSWIAQDNAVTAEVDALTIRYNGELEKLGFQQSAAYNRAMATMYRRRAPLAALSSASGSYAGTSLITSNSPTPQSTGSSAATINYNFSS